MHIDDIIDALWPKILNNELSSFVMALKVDQARNPRNYKEILQEMATEVPKLSQAGSYRRMAAEIATGEKLEGKYTREGKCPSSGVMPNGKIFIGNYTGKKWHEESVKPYHDEIRLARNENPKPGNCGNSANRSSHKLKKSRIKLKKVQAKVKKIEGRETSTSRAVNYIGYY